ncbi:vitamin B12 dependent-methionine synthase activation domain-containing protein [Clostridium cochlearium]|uniref:Methionine synthase n=1 Tax=Clostridium cochlearium TaxID=1494 RepID=A0A7Y3V7G0_CLOCO|nr:vitamin B12 dependent-methionine synthase activation domain-containing protein [Clostridium cochlearium]NOH16122.1 methionine synthase [Clostridium cochlearium]
MIKDLEINKKEVLRYLCCNGEFKDKKLEELIDCTIDEVKKLIKPKYVYNKFKIENTKEGVNFLGTNLRLEGEDIKKHLYLSKNCVLMAATLGHELDRKISLYEKINMTKAIIMDACGTVAIEELCDNIENYVKNQGKINNLNITYRYSPGYGDLDLKVQSKILSIMQFEKNIGITLSHSNIMAPKKSVTAIIGFVPQNSIIKKKSCSQCNKYNECIYRKLGGTCGN